MYSAKLFVIGDRLVSSGENSFNISITATLILLTSYLENDKFDVVFLVNDKLSVVLVRYRIFNE